MTRQPHGYETHPAYKLGRIDYTQRRWVMDAFARKGDHVAQQAYDRGLNDAMLDERENQENYDKLVINAN